MAHVSCWVYSVTPPVAIDSVIHSPIHMCITYARVCAESKRRREFRKRRNRCAEASVMSRSSAPVLPTARLLLSLLLIDASSAQTVLDIGCRAQSCATLDVALLQEYVTGLRQLNDTDQRPRDELSADELRLLPFGALDSDWERLMLLQDSQPEGTALRDNLLRLSRLVLAAYFHSQDLGVPGEKTDSSPVPEAEDQQASNATLGSAAQNSGSARIDASPSQSDSAAYNNGEETSASSEKFAGNDEEDPTATTSYYADSTSANFNQAFSTPASLDNEASGSKSNETSLAAAAADNEDESTRETWPESFSHSPSPALERVSSSPESNEAVHPRSEEDFLLSRYASKEARREDDELVAKFFAEEHDDSNDSMEDLLALMELEEAELLANQSTSESPLLTSADDNDSFEFNATRSLEALLDAMEGLNESSSASPDDPELTSSQELLELIDGLSAEDNPTTPLLQMISGKLSAETASYSNEASTTDSGENGRTDRSEEYSDTTFPSLSPTTDKASSENHTRELEETPTTTVDALPADWALTLTIDATPSSYGANSEPRQPGKILAIFRHSQAAGASSSNSSSNKLTWPTEVASSEEESASLNPTSSEKGMDRQPEIAGMNKRKRGGGGEPLL
ncbi:hypothetical protein TSAR_011738 [Trichomalopsis sarcophagae]|uniref:Uncharacterized protein n=1 Tax=Trichomalopsis sarcophagae TaxID=543379 RepID=A0A232EJ43_9HYME|nr:hypothetical protein TSAR_011738 [Trichomalopsis sarcophagae]